MRLNRKLWGWGVFVVLCISLVLSYAYILRNTFTTYDVAYFDDLFDHSQYTIAESYRMISDSDLYAITGLRLLRTGNPFADVPQAPPVGKYIYGYSIKLLGNPYVSNYLFLSFALILSGLIAYSITKSKKAFMYCILLLITSTQLIQQLNQTMLDIIQTTWLLGHIYFLLLWKKSSERTVATMTLSGFFLGLFAATKFGIFTPFILVIGLICVFRRTNIFAISTLLMGILIGFCLPYTSFIISHGMIQFLKSQKWVFLFWLAGNNSKAIYGMPFVTLITGMYKHFSPGTLWEWSKDWSPVWSVIGLLYIKDITEFAKKYLRNINIHRLFGSIQNISEYGYLLILVSLLLSVYSAIPFYPRYLLPVSVLLIIISVSKYWSVIRPRYLAIIIALCFGISSYRLYNTPKDLVDSLVNQVNHGLYKDLCRSIYAPSLPNESCDQFQERIHKLIYSLGASEVTISTGSVSSMIFNSNVTIPFNITYNTPIGVLTNNGNFQLIRRGNGYNLVWNDEYLLTGYTKDSTIQSKFIKGKKGMLLKEGKVIAEDIDKPYFVIHPNQIVSEEQVNKYIGRHMDKGDYYAQLKYKVNHSPDLPAEVGFVKILPLTYPIPAGIVIEQKRIASDQYQNADYRSELGGEIIMKLNGFPDKILLRKDVKDGMVISL